MRHFIWNTITNATVLLLILNLFSCRYYIIGSLVYKKGILPEKVTLKMWESTIFSEEKNPGGVHMPGAVWQSVHEAPPSLVIKATKCNFGEKDGKVSLFCCCSLSYNPNIPHNRNNSEAQRWIQLCQQCSFVHKLYSPFSERLQSG